MLSFSIARVVTIIVFLIIMCKLIHFRLSCDAADELCMRDPG